MFSGLMGGAPGEEERVRRYQLAMRPWPGQLEARQQPLQLAAARANRLWNKSSRCLLSSQGLTQRPPCPPAGQGGRRWSPRGRVGDDSQSQGSDLCQ